MCEYTLGANPAGLVKVTPQNDHQCVEYYVYHNQMYCSKKQLSAKKIDRRVKDYETQEIVFDDRPWLVAAGEQDESISMVEYVPLGENNDHWHESVVSQFAPGAQNSTTPKMFSEMVIEGIKKAGYDPIVTYIKDTPDQVIFESRLEAPKDLVQDEIQMITKGEKGLYILHYVISEPNMSQRNREKWLKNFSLSKIK